MLGRLWHPFLSDASFNDFVCRKLVVRFAKMIAVVKEFAIMNSENADAFMAIVVSL